MDDLINKIRNTQKPHAKRTVIAKQTLDTIPQSSVKRIPPVDESQVADIEIVDDQTASQNKFLLNFGLLSKYNSHTMKICDIEGLSTWKVEGTFYALVKHKESFWNSYKLTLVDETGVICACTNIATINIGDLLELNDCSVWRVHGNAINIVERNLSRILNSNQ